MCVFADEGEANFGSMKIWKAVKTGRVSYIYIYIYIWSIADSTNTSWNTSRRSAWSSPFLCQLGAEVAEQRIVGLRCYLAVSDARAPKDHVHLLSGLASKP